MRPFLSHLLPLLLVAGCAGGAGSDPPARVRADGAAFGEELEVTVRGHGTVESDPGGVVCSSAGDAKSCAIGFGEPKVVLRATPDADWSFEGWVFVVDDRSTDFDPPPLGLDLGAAELVLAGGTRVRPDGGQRAVRHRVSALFVPSPSK